MKPTLQRGLRHRFFVVTAHDGIDPVGEGRHQRFVVIWDTFNARLARKVNKAANCERQLASGHG